MRSGGDAVQAAAAGPALIQGWGWSCSNRAVADACPFLLDFKRGSSPMLTRGKNLVICLSKYGMYTEPE